MRRLARPFMLATILVSLLGLTPTDEPRPRSEQICVEFNGQCLTPQQLAGSITVSMWNGFSN